MKTSRVEASSRPNGGWYREDRVSPVRSVSLGLGLSPHRQYFVTDLGQKYPLTVFPALVTSGDETLFPRSQQRPDEAMPPLHPTERVMSSRTGRHQSSLATR